MAGPAEPWSPPPTDRSLLATAAVLLATSRIALLVLRPAAVRRIVERIAPALPPSGRVEDPDRIAGAVRTARRRLPLAPACLGTAVVAHAMLAAHDHRSDLQIGVAKAGPDDLRAHAWVERDGRVLVGDVPDLARFRRLHPDGGNGEVGRRTG